MPRRPRSPTQLALSARGRHGGFRAGAGRKPKPEAERKGHRARPALASRFPVHVTMKCRPAAPHLRRRDAFLVVRRAIAQSHKARFRLVHFTVQGNHLHLLCEAKDKPSLARGVQGLAIRIARRLNARTGRAGKLFAERYHARILRSPTEVKRALTYVLNNSRRHAPADVTFAPDWIDPLSSAPWFDGWKRPAKLYEEVPGACPVVAAATWLLATGWRLRGRIAPDEVPRLDAPVARSGSRSRPGRM